MSGLQIHIFPALKDNYAFLIRDTASGKTASIDAPDADLIAHALQGLGWDGLDLLLNTHWHPDHAGGNATLKARYGCVIQGPEEVAKTGPLDHVLCGGDQVALGATVFDVLDLKGHTLGHVGYSAPSEKVAFVGDTLFALGCGRLFEGTAEDMWQSLQRIAALDPQTLICCAHEYTLSNLAFAESLTGNWGACAALETYGQRVRDQRAKGQPTVPTRLSDEIAANPFLYYPLREDGLSAQIARFAELRAAKDVF